MTISGNARIAGIMGWPVKHSRSPRLHNFWLEHYGIDGVYVPFPVDSSGLEAALRALPKLGIAGVNVTVPHKEQAFRIVDETDETARRIGAVNTITITGDGFLAATNTDSFGFTEALRARAPEWDPASGPAVVFGAGGASRAILVALQDLGVAEIRLVNRTLDRAEALVGEFGAPLIAVPWAERESALQDAGLLVNTTILGMQGQPPLDLGLDDLPQAAVVNDIVYAPLHTPLLRAAGQRGNVVVDGLEMLLHQARPGFRAWFGHEPEVTEELRRFVGEDLL
ncbi:MAG: shikimate dehydrogenase [Rhodospirillales bacterium]|nr:shikimate dehydrogenase [Rhodospirillales bacterium]